MQHVLPYFFLLLVIIMFILNTLALMNLLPLYLTLPLLFISIYLMFYSFTYKKAYRGSQYKRRMIQK